MNNLGKWNYTFISIAKTISHHSTCIRKKVGCIITIDRRIISMGYNGVVPGKPHCEELFKGKTNIPEFYESHGKFSKLNEIHAEQNCISYAAKNGLSIGGGTLYTTVSPCIDCSKIIVSSGILKVIYLEEYDRDKSGLDFLGTRCEQISLRESRYE